MNIKATLETRQSKSGNNYEVIVIKLSEHSEKLVFLTQAEMELLKINNSEKKSSFLK